MNLTTQNVLFLFAGVLLGRYAAQIIPSRRIAGTLPVVEEIVLSSRNGGSRE